MTQNKFDYLVEAIHLDAAGKLENVRLYERRGPSFSDRIIISREQLVRQLKAGKKVVAGSRQAYLASTFSLTGDIMLSGSKDSPVLVLGEEPANEDSLPGIPIF